MLVSVSVSVRIVNQKPRIKNKLHIDILCSYMFPPERTGHSIGTLFLHGEIVRNKFNTNFVCVVVSSMLSGLKIRSLGLNTLGTT